MSTSTATIDREQLGQAARMRSEGATWKAIGTLFGYTEKTIRGAMDRAIVREQLGQECPAVASAIPAEWYGAMAAHLEGTCPACNTPDTGDADAAAVADRVLSGETTFLDEVGAILNGQPVTPVAEQPATPAEECAAIVDSHYADTVAQLVNDPHIIDMANGLMAMPMEDLVHANGRPRHEFMMGALDEYNKRTAEGGGIGTHIGGPVDAVLIVLAGLKAKALEEAVKDDEPADLAETAGAKVRAKNAAKRNAAKTVKPAEEAPTPAPAAAPAAYPADDLTRRAEAVIDATDGGARLAGKTDKDAGTVNTRTASYMQKIGPFKVVDMDGARRLVRAAA